MVVLCKQKKIHKFKAGNKNVNFPFQICPRSTSKKFAAAESRKV